MPKQYQARVEAIQRRKKENKAAKDIRDAGRAPDQILSKASCKRAAQGLLHALL